VNRRRFLAGCGAALVAGACSQGDDAAAPDLDLDLATEAAGVEKLAYDHYAGTGLAATEGRLGALLPPAVTTLWATAAGQHRHVHDRWNALLAGAGRSEVTGPRDQVKDALNAAAARVSDIPAAVTLALRLEDYACRLYQRALPDLRNAEAVTLAAQVAVVGHQRQALYRYLLGLDPVAGAATELSLRVLNA
jgi:hypothetical protein